MAERSETVEELSVRDGSAVYSVESEIARAEEVPPRHTRTEVGMVPKNWAVKPVSDLASVKTGPFGSSLHESDYVEEGTPIVTVEHLGDYGLAHHNLPMVSEHDRKRLSRYKLLEGDIVFSRVGSVDRNSLVRAGESGWLFSGRLLRVRVTSSNIHPQYLSYHFHSEAFKQRVRDVAVGQTMASLNTKILSGVLTIIPSSLDEQRAIATALSDADALIESLDRLIAKKRAIKLAAMQQLLTGQMRLPGFTGEWETKRLGDYVSFLKTGTNSRAELTSNGLVVYLHYGDIHVGTSTTLDPNAVTMPHIAASKVCHLEKLAPGDLVFVDASEDLEGVGKSVEVIDVPTEGMVAGLHTIAARFDKDVLADGFKAYLQFCPQFIGTLRRLAAGTKVLATNRQHIASVEMELPRVAEQQVIAAVLFDMETEIEGLERRRNKARKIKQGMMQQLLTGRVRLVQPSVAHAEAGTNPEAGKGHSKQFNEAVVISMLARYFGTEEFPLGRKRYTKLSYLLHRHTDGRVEDYLKKAAGPYNPKTKYGGAEKIALKKGYLKEHKGARGHSGFIAADNVAEAERYFHNWYGPDAVQWLDQFRFKSNDDLEVLATVDMAAQELRTGGREVDVSAVKDVIQSNAEWQPKLNRKVFSDEHIAQAITQSESLLRPSRKGVT
jgi:type I restriction enzyme S subunit